MIVTKLNYTKAPNLDFLKILFQDLFRAVHLVIFKYVFRINS